MNSKPVSLFLTLIMTPPAQLSGSCIILILTRLHCTIMVTGIVLWVGPITVKWGRKGRSKSWTR